MYALFLSYCMLQLAWSCRELTCGSKTEYWYNHKKKKILKKLWKKISCLRSAHPALEFGIVNYTEVRLCEILYQTIRL